MSVEGGSGHERTYNVPYRETSIEWSVESVWLFCRCIHRCGYWAMCCFPMLRKWMNAATYPQKTPQGIGMRFVISPISIHRNRILIVIANNIVIIFRLLYSVNYYREHFPFTFPMGPGRPGLDQYLLFGQDSISGIRPFFYALNSSKHFLCGRRDDRTISRFLALFHPKSVCVCAEKSLDGNKKETPFGCSLT